MSESPDGNGNGSRVLTKDVYDLVDASRREINSNLETLGTKLDAFVTSNEHRLTIVETHQAAQAAAISEVVERLDEHGKEIGTLKDQQKADEVAADVKKARWTAREKLVGIICSLAIAAGAIVTIISLLASH